MSDFPEKAKDEVNTLAVVAIGLSTVAILWASVLALQAFFITSEGEIAAQQAENGRAVIVRDLKAEQTADLGLTTYADTQKRTLKRLDIEYAKSVVVRDAQRGATTLIPTLGELNVPTINLEGNPLVVTPPAPTPPAPAPTAPTDGSAPPADGTATPPKDGATPTAPAGGTAVPVAPAAPAPAGPKPGGQ